MQGSYYNLTLLSYYQTKNDNQKKETKYLMKLFGSDMWSRDTISTSILSESQIPVYNFLGDGDESLIVSISYLLQI